MKRKVKVLVCFSSNFLSLTKSTYISLDFSCFGQNLQTSTNFKLGYRSFDLLEKSQLIRKHERVTTPEIIDISKNTIKEKLKKEGRKQRKIYTYIQKDKERER